MEECVSDGNGYSGGHNLICFIWWVCIYTSIIYLFFFFFFLGNYFYCILKPLSSLNTLCHLTMHYFPVYKMFAFLQFGLHMLFMRHLLTKTSTVCVSRAFSTWSKMSFRFLLLRVRLPPVWPEWPSPLLLLLLLLHSRIIYSTHLFPFLINWVKLNIKFFKLLKWFI